MKRFVFSLITFFGLLGVGLVCACFYIPSKTVGRSMLSVQKTKLERFSQIASPRIVLVGGSGLGMGMQTSELSKKLNLPVYNMGLHAGLGLVYQLSATPPSQLSKGDIVVIVPEYANFEGGWCFGEQELVAILVDILPEHRKYISFAHWMRLWKCLAQYGAGKIRRCFLLRREGGGICPVDNYDAFGDAKWSQGTPDAQFVFPSARRLSARDFSPIILRYIRECVDACRGRDVRVVLLPPAYQSRSYDNQAGFIQKVAEELERNGTPFLVPPERYRLLDEYFYDTPYHLNLLGRRLRTGMMVEDLAGCEHY